MEGGVWSLESGGEGRGIGKVFRMEEEEKVSWRLEAGV